MRIPEVFLVAFNCLLVLSCGGGTSKSAASDRGLVNGYSLASMTGSNVMGLTVNGSLCLTDSQGNLDTSKVRVNSACVAVTVCPPGASTSNGANCQTISGLLVDTGSVGLRVFKSSLNSGLLSALTPVVPDSGSGTVANCTTYADGYGDWGPLANATVFMGGEPGVSTPIQLIDSSYGGSGCPDAAGVTLDQTTADLGFNGILGLGLYPQDCGSRCTTSSRYHLYYKCNGNLSSGSGCSATTLSLSKQLQNPVYGLPADNNGIVVMLPQVTNLGASYANGYVVFGVGTQSNNAPDASVVTLPADLSAGVPLIAANLNGGSGDAFIDSGSNIYSFPAGSSTSGLVDCVSYNAYYSGWYCPKGGSSNSANISMTLLGYQGSPSVALSLLIGNPSYLSGNVFSNLGVITNLSGFSSSTTDLGLPFYLGRNVYHGYQNKSSSLGSGAYWAF